MDGCLIIIKKLIHHFTIFIMSQSTVYDLDKTNVLIAQLKAEIQCLHQSIITLQDQIDEYKEELEDCENQNYDNGLIADEAVKQLKMYVYPNEDIYDLYTKMKEYGRRSS